MNYTAAFGAAYRYGFNGKENDKSFDSKTIQDYGFRLYSPALCKFLSVDPLSPEYPELTPYQFASNTPIQAIDLDGLEAYVIVDKGNWATGNVGHTFIAVKTEDDIVVYTYGRWAGTYGSSIGGIHTPVSNGPGIMIKLTGKDATAEIQKYVNLHSAKVFEIKNAEDAKVQQDLENEFNKSTQSPTKGSFVGDPRAHQIDEYDLQSNNCTTKSCEALKEGLKDSKLSYLYYGSLGIKMADEDSLESFSPKGLSSELSGASRDKDSGVIDVTKDFKVQKNN